MRVIGMASVWSLIYLTCAQASAQEYPPFDRRTAANQTPEWREWQAKLDAMSASELVDSLAFPQTTQQVQATLKKRGNTVVPPLIAALTRRDKFVSSGAAQLLGDLREESAVPALVEFAKRNKKNLPVAARALSAIGGQEAADFLLEQLPKTEPGSEEPFIRGLMEIGDLRAVEPLAAVLGDSRRPFFIRELAVEALTRFCDPRARSALQKAVDDDPDWRVYYDAKCALEKISAKTEGSPYQRATYKKHVEKLCKIPTPPEGIEAYVKKYSGGQIAYFADGSDFLPQAEIDLAKDELVAAAKSGDADVVVEELMILFIWPKAPDRLAKEVIAKIGSATAPALKNGAKRGPPEFSRACQECLGRK